jgi:hypothetical protein
MECRSGEMDTEVIGEYFLYIRLETWVETVWQSKRVPKFMKYCRCDFAFPLWHICQWTMSFETCDTLKVSINIPRDKESGRSAADNLLLQCASLQCYTPHHSSGGNELDSKSREVNHDGRPSVVHLEWLSLVFRQLAYRVIAFQLRICYSAKMNEISK